MAKLVAAHGEILHTASPVQGGLDAPLATTDDLIKLAEAFRHPLSPRRDDEPPRLLPCG